MNRHVRRKLATLSRGPNARSDLGLEEEARALWRSYKLHPLHYFIILASGIIVDGNRRHWGAEREGDLDCEVDCQVVEGEITPELLKTLQLVSALHRSDISAFDKAAGINDLLASGMSNKQVCEELSLKPADVTRYNSLFGCIPEVIEAAKAGKIGVADWYSLHDQPADLQKEMVAARLGGESIRAKVAGRKKARSEPSDEKERSIQVVLPSGVTAVFKGRGLTLEMVKEAGPAVKRLVEKAAADKHDVESFPAWNERYLADLKAKRENPKPPRPPKAKAV